MLIIVKSVVTVIILVAAWQSKFVRAKATASPDQLLELGNEALSDGSNDQAVQYYRQGIHVLSMTTTTTVEHWQQHDRLVTELSLYTNLATALSSEGKNEEAIEVYQNALLTFKSGFDKVTDPTIQRDAKDIAAQAAFFLGMVCEDLGHNRDAIDAYSYSYQLDQYHWAAQANLGAILHDQFADHRAALAAYNRAYRILVDTNHEPTDPPPQPQYILSQLQYRIGLCLSHDIKSKNCVIVIDDNIPNKNKNQYSDVSITDDSSSISSSSSSSSSSSNNAIVVDCHEMAMHAFALAVKYDTNNESAKHMLATMTADVTVTRASNLYVKALFDDYAMHFEHSLVTDLGYNGFDHLRIAFDRAMLRQKQSKNVLLPPFDIVIDAGCGTGLVGAQFRNISHTLIGVDLSQAILDQASQLRPGLYEELIVGDVMDVFVQRKPLSLIVAGDSYIYFGDLQPLFAAMADGLRDGGYAAFTLENVSAENEKTLAESKPDWRWQLTASGRFAHRRDYVIRVGGERGLALIHYEPMDGFRFEYGVGVRGHIFIMQKLPPEQRPKRSQGQEL